MGVSVMCEGVTLTMNKEIIIQICTPQIIHGSASIGPGVCNDCRYNPEGAIPKLFHSVTEPQWFKTITMETDAW